MYLKTTKSMPKQFICFFLLLFCFYSYAQDESFENTTVPTNWITTPGGTLSTSSDHYKLGNKSLEWSWTANDILVVSDLQTNGLVVSEVLGYFEGMFRAWVYNTSKISSLPLTFEFYDTTGTLQFYYDFQLNFTGWRAASASYKTEMSGNKSSSDIATLKIKAPSSGSGTFYFDYIDFTLGRNLSRGADYQLPFIPRKPNHWYDMAYLQTLPKTIALITPTSQVLAEFNLIKQAYDSRILGTTIGSSALANAVNKYNALNISYIGGNITGKPLYGKDFPSSQNIGAVDEFISIFARDYKQTSNTASLTYFLNTVRYFLDQGYAEGSEMETTHHIGYTFMKLPGAIHLMKDELIVAGLWEEARKMVEWYSAVDIIWHPTAFDSNMDDAITRTMSILGCCLYKTTDDEKVQYLKGYKSYIENWLTTYPTQGEGLKVDYSGFHHEIYYAGYAIPGYNNLTVGLNHLLGGYQISTGKKDILKNALLLARIITSNSDGPIWFGGRHPFPHTPITSGLKNLGLADPVDEQLLGAYNFITGGDSDTNSYATEVSPTGFWQVNYSNLGTYRQDDWVVNMKGFNKYFKGNEIYSTANRYGRYQSYGTIEVLYDGGNVNSGFNLNGWDWNKPPGTTTIHMSWADLVAVNAINDEKTDSNFAASLRFKASENAYIDSKLEGSYGVFGMNFTQKQNTPSHNPTFTFKKSTFSFDGKIICLGSNINNDDTGNITATNLFQNYLNSTSSPILINNTATTTFPYNGTLSNTDDHWLMDAVNTGYYIKPGNSIVIDRKNQDSPNQNGNGTFTNDNFASAYINHGTSPLDAGYEYVIIPETNASAMATFESNMQNSSTAFYEVIQKDSEAHIVKYNDMYGYALFELCNFSNSGPVKRNDTPCLVMTSQTGTTMNLTLVDPNMNFAENKGGSQSTTIDITLNGYWTLNSNQGGSVVLSQGTDETTLTISAKDGLPVDMELQSSMTATTYAPFYYEDFNAHGYTIQTTSDPNNISESSNYVNLINGVTSANSEQEFSETRPVIRIPTGGVRAQKAININGNLDKSNYEAETWVVLNTLDITDSNPLIDKSDASKYVSFWTSASWANGNTSSFTLQASTDYTDDVLTANWTDVSSKIVGKIAKTNIDHNIFVNGKLDISSYSSKNFTLAFKYTGSDLPYNSTSRNGVYKISDVKFMVANNRASSMSAKKIKEISSEIIVYPNPIKDRIYIKTSNLKSQIKNLSLLGLDGRKISSENKIDLLKTSYLASGIYLLRIELENGEYLYRKIIKN